MSDLMIAGRKVVTTHWLKPIPLRQFDWEASFADHDLGDHVGYGLTEQAAIDDLKMWYEE